MLGSYQVNVQVGKLPQKVASAFTSVFEGWVGASYTPVAYLGSKITNGTNHAILAFQTLITGSDVHNIVIVVLNEKPAGGEDAGAFTIADIQTVLSDGGQLGGISIAPTSTIPAEAMSAFSKNFVGLLGGKIKPFALLATQMVNGPKYIFAVETSMVVSPNAILEGGADRVCLLTVLGNYGGFGLTPILEGTPKTLLGTAPALPAVQWP